MSRTPTVRIVHELPGRVRVRLSVAPRHVEGLREAIKAHPGIQSIDYTAPTRSVLVRFDPQEVSAEEIFVRVGFNLSIDYDAVPVRILADSEVAELSESVFYAGLLIAAALIQRLFRRGRPLGLPLDLLAGIGTAAAVLEHAWRDIRRQGNFDPENLSLVYLLSAMLRGDTLPGAFITWVTTFGRHLLKRRPAGVELRPVRGDDGEYELGISATDLTEPETVKLVRLIPDAIRGALDPQEPPVRKRDLIDEIRVVSRLHQRVLEGLGAFRHGIPLRIDS